MIPKQELQQIRIETATQICINYPHLMKMLFQRFPEEARSIEERIRFNILLELTKLEPSIKHILSFYMKRNG